MDIWDWLKGLRSWWWMLVVIPLLAGVITWFAHPEPEYESTWTVNLVIGDPATSNNPAYFDFVLLDDFALLVRTSVFGDVLYLRLPGDVQSKLTRQEFGEMIESFRRARFVDVRVSGHDPELVKAVATTIEQNAEEVANFYLMPPTYAAGSVTLNTLNPVTEPVLDTRSRQVAVASVTGAAILAAVAATGVAEWLRLSYRAKYAER